MTSSPPSFIRFRRPLTLVHITASIALALALLVALNYLATRHPVRYKWLKHDRFELSELSIGILNSLTNEVRVTVYSNPEESTALHGSINGLLAEYAFQSPLIRIQRIDYLRDRQAAQEIAQTYQLTGDSPSDLVIFASGDRHRIVSHQELSDYQTAASAEAILQGQREIKRVGFKGELLFTSALLSVTSGEPIPIAYLNGHGEHDLESDGLEGYAAFRQAMKEKNFELIPHHLIEDGPLPPHIAMLMIAGPRHPFTNEELAEVERFLERGGRLFLLFNVNGLQQPTGLERLVRQWGIQVGMNVVDDIHKLMGTELAVANYEDHPATTPLVNAEAALLLFLPRSIEPLPRRAIVRPGELTVQGLAYTSTNGLTQSDFQGGQARFSHYRDRRGAIPVIAAAQAESNPSATPSLSGQARLLVGGDSFFLTNRRLRHYGNREFASLAAAWLLDQDQLLQSIGPQPLYEFKLHLPDRDFRRIQILMLAVFPGAVFLWGMVVWWRRRI